MVIAMADMLLICHRFPNLYRSGVAVAAPTVKKMLKIQKKEKNDFSHDFWTHL